MWGSSLMQWYKRQTTDQERVNNSLDRGLNFNPNKRPHTHARTPISLSSNHCIKDCQRISLSPTLSCDLDFLLSLYDNLHLILNLWSYMSIIRGWNYIWYKYELSVVREKTLFLCFPVSPSFKNKTIWMNKFHLSVSWHLRLQRVYKTITGT